MTDKPIPPPPCSGIIVFDGDKTILVKTEEGHYSMPKGKKEKGEVSIITAFRELREETGLIATDIALYDGITFDETNEKGNLSVRYYVGVITKPAHTFTFDAKELVSVEWVPVTEALSLPNYLDRRKEILRQAYTVHTNQVSDSGKIENGDH